jgi:hypothetical protein
MRYLLGGLSDKEKADLEERFFSDDQEFEELEIAETELIDRYVRHELSASERRLFESNLSETPRLAERVRIAKIIAAKVARLGAADGVAKPAPVPIKDPWWRKLFRSHALLSPAFATAAVLVFGVVLAIVYSEYRHETQRLNAETQQRVELERQIAELKSRSDKLDEDLQKAIREREELLAKLKTQSPEKPDSPVARFATLLLAPGTGVRSGGGSGNELRLTPEFTAVDLTLDVSEGDSSRYVASVETAERKVVARFTNLRPVQSGDKKVIRLRVDAESLSAGDYIVKVDGVGATGVTRLFNYYSFGVTRR